MSRPTFIGSTLMLMLMVIVGCVDDPISVSLSEVKRFALPNGFRPNRLAFGPTGQVAVLSMTPPSVPFLHDSIVAVVDLPDSVAPIGIRFVGQAQGVEVLDTMTGSVIRIRAVGGVQETTPFVAPTRPTQAVAGPGGWFVFGLSDEEEFELYWVRQNSWQYLIGIPSDGQGQQMFLDSRSDEAALTLTDSPFSVIVVDTTGTIDWYRSGTEIVDGWLSNPSAARAFPAVFAGEVVLQTIVAPRLDSYRTAIFDLSGELLRVNRAHGRLARQDVEGVGNIASAIIPRLDRSVHRVSASQSSVGGAQLAPCVHLIHLRNGVQVSMSSVS